jgi:radical SAM protein with 4Fe4S-binding SPASM domain
MAHSTRPKLHAVALELTRYCNQKCDYCYNGFRGDPAEPTHGVDLWPTRVARLLESFEIERFTLTGGEPFAYRGVFDVLAQLQTAGVPAQMISNAGMIDDSRARELARLRPLSIQVTLNGHTRELHEAHVGPGHHAATLDGLASLLRHGVSVTGCIVLTRKNAHAVGDILRIWHAMGVGRVALSRFSPAGYASQHVAELLPSRQQLLAAFSEAQPFARDLGMQLYCTMPIPPCVLDTQQFAPIQFGFCAVGTALQEIAIGPDGRVRNCTLHRAAIADAGDIADPGLDLVALLGSAELRDYTRHAPAFCRGCEHEDSCGGGCGAASEWLFGSRQRLPDPLVSQYIDDDFAEQLRLGRTRADARPPKRHLTLSP